MSSLAEFYRKSLIISYIIHKAGSLNICYFSDLDRPHGILKTFYEPNAMAKLELFPINLLLFILKVFSSCLRNVYKN